MMNDPYKKKNICGIVIDPERFITNILSTKLRSISVEDFNVICYTRNDRIIFSTGNRNLSVSDVQQSKNLRLLPDHKLGIVIVGKTVGAILKERTTTNFIMIIILTCIVYWFPLTLKVVLQLTSRGYHN